MFARYGKTHRGAIAGINLHIISTSQTRVDCYISDQACVLIGECRNIIVIQDHAAHITENQRRGNEPKLIHIHNLLRDICGTPSYYDNYQSDESCENNVLKNG
jgi:hypothetical protein